MRIWIRWVVWLAATFGTLFAVPRMLSSWGVNDELAFGISIALFLLGGNGLGYVVLRCPHCGKPAYEWPNGYFRFWPGLRCPHCHSEY